MPITTLGSVSSGTHRTVDLVPVFLDVLSDHDRAAASAIHREYGARISAIREWDDTLDIGAAEEDGDLLHALIDALNDIAPEDTYFGAHEGDGADFGFWPIT